MEKYAKNEFTTPSLEYTVNGGLPMSLHVKNKFNAQVQVAYDKVAAASGAVTAAKDKVNHLIDLEQEIIGGTSIQGRNV